MRLCLPARMGGGGKAESLPRRGPAVAQRLPHGGDYSALGNERAKPLAFPPIRKRSRSGSPGRTAAQRRHPCMARRQPDALRADLWASGRPASREARVPAGQHKNAAPLGAQSAGQSATSALPAHFLTLPIVTRMGRDYRPGLRQQIERVARRAAPSDLVQRLIRLAELWSVVGVNHLPNLPAH